MGSTNSVMSWIITLQLLWLGCRNTARECKKAWIFLQKVFIVHSLLASNLCLQYVNSRSICLTLKYVTLHSVWNAKLCLSKIWRRVHVKILKIFKRPLKFSYHTHKPLYRNLLEYLFYGMNGFSSWYLQSAMAISGYHSNNFNLSLKFLKSN